MDGDRNDLDPDTNERTIDRIFAQLKSELGHVRDAAFQQLVGMGQPAVKRLIQKLAAPDADTRLSAVMLLGEIGDRRAVDPLIATLQTDPDEEVRANAAHALGRIRDPRAFEPLVRALQDASEHLWVRGRAAWALGWLGDPHAGPALIQALTTDEFSGVRASAAYSLGQLGYRAAVEPLLQAVLASDAGDVDDLEVVNNAALALQMLGDTSVVEPLSLALSQRPEVCIWSLTVVQLLGGLGDRRAVPALEWARTHQPTSLAVPASFYEAVNTALQNIAAHQPE